MKKKVVSVIGGDDCDVKVEAQAALIGKELSPVVDILIIDGLSGVMRAVSSGFKARRSSIGIIPGYNRKDTNKFLDIVLPTGCGWGIKGG